MTDHAVVVAGGGPVGLMLAGELSLAGVDVVVVERRHSQEVEGTRARGLHPRTLEILDQRGVVDRFISAGRPRSFVGYARASLDVSDLPTRHNYFLGLFQGDLERILSDWVLGDLAVPIVRGCEVVGLSQSETSVAVELSSGSPLRAQYLVGCDGGRSIVRKSAGIEFPGWDPTSSQLIAEVEMAEEPELGMRAEVGSIEPVDRSRRGGPYRVVLLEPRTDRDREPSLEDVRAALVAAYGTDYGVCEPRWISRFTDTCRQAASYRSGRVLLAGDAAHVHGPQGGQGLNIGLQDSVNLGWKLAQVINGASPESFLDTYQAERHPVGAQVLQNTMAQVALGRSDARSQALNAAMSELLEMEEPRQRIAAMMAGLDIRYDLGGSHPLVGHRMPDLDLITDRGMTTVFALMHDAKPVLVDLADSGDFDLSPRANRIRTASARHAGELVLPLLGEVDPVSSVAIRPDGHVAWAGDLTDPSLPRSLTAWFG